MRGYCAIGIFHGKKSENVGTLWRTADAMDAAYVFTIGRRYSPQASDTPKTWLHTPCFHFTDFADFYAHIPYDARLIGVEQAPEAVGLYAFRHPERAIYLLGAEDHGLPDDVRAKCHAVVEIPTRRCLNVSVAGSIILADRDRCRGRAARLEAA